MGVVLQGHRTYPAFVHFLCCVTLLSIYIAIMSISALWYAFHYPFTIVSPEYRLLLSIPDELMCDSERGYAHSRTNTCIRRHHIHTGHRILLLLSPIPHLVRQPSLHSDTVGIFTQGFLSLAALIKLQLNISRPSCSYGTYLLCPVGDTRFLIPHWNRNYLLPSEGSSKTLTEPYAFMTSAGGATGPKSLAGLAHSGGCFECGAAVLRM